MNGTSTTRPIHPTEARRAFGADRDHPAIPGLVVGLESDCAALALVTGTWVTVTVDDPRYLAALQREDLSHYRNRELVMLLNAHYGLVGLAVGPVEVPSRLAVRYGVCRLENGSAVEIPGDGPQPGWLLFRCAVRQVLAAGISDRTPN